MSSKIVKTLATFSLCMSIVAVAIAAYALFEARSVPAQGPVPPAGGADVKTVVLKVIDRPRWWEGTEEFFEQNRPALKANMEVANLFETDGVGIVFVRTATQGKRFQFCVWVRKLAGGGWREFGYLNPYAEEPFRVKWVQRNEEWLKEMESKRKEWEKQCDSAWTIQ